MPANEKLDLIKFIESVPNKHKTKTIKALALSTSTYYRWKDNYDQKGLVGLVDQPPIPHIQPNKLLKEEIDKIIEVAKEYDLKGYRSVTYLLEKEGVYICESTCYRYLKENGLIISRDTPKREPAGDEWKTKPTRPNEIWHTDITYIWIEGYGFFYLFTYLDAYSRFVIHSELKRQMTVDDTIETLKNALNKAQLPKEHRLKLITDNGTQYMAKRFRGYLKKQGITHIRTAYRHPETNGKIERWHRSLKEEKMIFLGFKTPQDARDKIAKFVDLYNTQRPHQAIDNVTPKQKFDGVEKQVLKERELMRAQAREKRRMQNGQTVAA